MLLSVQNSMASEDFHPHHLAIFVGPGTEEKKIMMKILMRWVWNMNIASTKKLVWEWFTKRWAKILFAMKPWFFHWVCIPGRARACLQGQVMSGTTIRKNCWFGLVQVTDSTLVDSGRLPRGLCWLHRKWWQNLDRRVGHWVSFLVSSIAICRKAKVLIPAGK